MKVVVLAFLCFFWYVASSSNSASNLANIVSALKSKKGNLEASIIAATSSFEEKVDLEALEQFSCILWQKQQDFRTNKDILNFSQALAKYASANLKEIRSSNVQMLRTALLLNATFTSHEECPNHKGALSSLVSSFKDHLSKKKFISDSVKTVQLSSFILPEKLIFSRNFLSFDTLASLLDEYISSIFEAHEDVEKLPHEHLFGLATCIWKIGIPVPDSLTMRLFSFFHEKLPILRECDLFKVYIRLLIRYFPDIDTCDCEECEAQAKWFIALLICDETLQLLSEQDYFYAAVFFTKIEAKNDEFFASSFAALTATGRAFLERLSEKEQLISNFNKLLKLLLVNDEKYDDIYRASVKHNVLLRLRPIAENPSNAFLVEALTRVILESLTEFKHSMPSEAVLCYVYGASSLLLKFPSTPEVRCPLYLNTIKTLDLLVKLKTSNEATSMSLRYTEIINDAFLEDMFNNFKGFSNTFSDEYFCLAIHFEGMLSCLKLHSNPVWIRMTLNEFFTEFLISSSLSDCQRMFELHRKYQEIDAFCFFNAFNALNSIPEFSNHKRMNHFARILIEYDGFSQTEAEMIKLLS